MLLRNRLNWVGMLGGLCTLLFATSSANALIPHVNSFELPADTAEWFQTGTVDSITRVPSGGGTLSVPSNHGAFHAEVANSPDDYFPGYGTSMYTQSGGPVAAYAGDFYVALDVYVNTATWLPVGLGDGVWIDASPRNVNTNTSDFNAEVNFRIEVPSAGNIQVSAASLVGAPSVVANLTSSGWYTLVITFRKTGNLTTDPVFSDQSIYSASGMLLGTTSRATLMASSDLGGNSYEHWITAWKNGFAGDLIAVDNSRTGFLPFGVTRVVDDDGMASAADCDALVPCFATIQSAITASSAGDTIKVCPGNYPENVTVNKSLALLGAQAGVDARGRIVGAANPAIESIINPASGDLITLVTGSAGSTIDGFALRSGARGITSGTGPLNGLQIKNNDSRGLTASAVFLNDSGSDITVDKNAFDGASQTSGALFHLDTDGFSGFHFTNNWLQNRTGGTGFFVDGNRNVNPSANRNPLFSGNLIKLNQTGMNAGTRAILGTSTASPAQIINNTFDGNAFDGFQGGPKWTSISGNQFINNGRNAVALTSFGNMGADRGAQFSTVTCNNFQGNGFVNTGSAISFSATQAAGTISSNTANNNNIRGNRAGATYTGAETINAETNWWGTFDGPSGAYPGTGDSVSSVNIDAVPFLASAAACAPDASTMTLSFNQACYKPGDTATVTLRMSDLQTPAAGFQAFLAYNTTRLTFTGWQYTCNPFALWVLNTPAFVNPSPGNLNLAAGIRNFATGSAPCPGPAQSPTLADADLVTLSFTVIGSDVCSIGNLVTFRTNNPPTRLTDINGAQILPLITLDAGAVTIDGTAPAITFCPPPVTIQCHESTEPGIPLGVMTGGVMIYYNLTGPESPATQAYLEGHFDYSNSNGGAFVFSNAPLTGFGPLTWANIFNELGQYGYDFVLPAPTNDSSVPVPVLLAYNNTNNSAAGRAADGPRIWTIGDYKDGAGGASNPLNVDINSLFRSPSPGIPGVDLVPSFTVSLAGTVYTAQVSGKLVSDGLIHWYNPATPDTPMAAYGMDGEFFFTGTLTYDSAGDDGTDRKDFYQGSLTFSANSPNTALGFARGTDNCTMFPTVTYTDVNNLGGCNGTGTIDRTWKITDCAGNSTTCLQVITVADTTPPVISCPAGQSLQCAEHIPAAHATVADFITAGGTASDNCSPVAGLVLTHIGDGPLTGGPCGGTITRTYQIADACGNNAVCTQVFTVNDTTAPVATSTGPIALCYPDVASAEAAAMANSNATDNCIGMLVEAATTVGTCSATVSVTFTDQCTNVSNVLTYSTRIDNTPPVITCPPDVVVTPPAGTCNAASVVVGTATATDNCSGPIVIVGTRSDNGATDGQPAFNDPYPQGVTTITWTATDGCGNMSTCLQTVTVNGVTLTVDVELSPTIDDDQNGDPLGQLDRCITFEVFSCPNTTPVVYSQVLSFTYDAVNNRALASNQTVCIPSTFPTTITCVTARDTLHTLRSRVTTLALDGLVQTGPTTFDADFTGTTAEELARPLPPPVTPGSGHRLVGGNLNDDIFVDILDFGTWAGQFDFNPLGAEYATGNTTCSTASPHSDISGDGHIDSGDFSFIAINFLMVSQDNCCSTDPIIHPGDGDFPVPHENPMPVTSISVHSLIKMGLGHMAAGDVNHDGMLDQADIQAVFGGQLPTPVADVPVPELPPITPPNAGDVDTKRRRP